MKQQLNRTAIASMSRRVVNVLAADVESNCSFIPYSVDDVELITFVLFFL